MHIYRIQKALVSSGLLGVSGSEVDPKLTKVIDPILPVVSMLGYWAISLGNLEVQEPLGYCCSDCTLGYYNLHSPLGVQSTQLWGTSGFYVRNLNHGFG